MQTTCSLSVIYYKRNGRPSYIYVKERKHFILIIFNKVELKWILESPILFIGKIGNDFI